MKKFTRQIIFAMSDTHGGYKLGLNYENPLNAAQEMLNETYDWGIQETKKLAGKDEIVVLHIGDITHGMKYLDGQTSTKMSDQIRIAIGNFEPILSLQNVKRMRIAVGTYSHNFGEGSSEDLVLMALQNKYPRKSLLCSYHGLLDISGLTIDYAHHGPTPGYRNWLVGNVARLYLKSLMLDDTQRGKIPPHLVLRGHYHTFVKEWSWVLHEGRRHESWLIIMPPISLANGYAIQATKSQSYISFGTIAIEVINGKIVETFEFIKTLDIRDREESL